MAEQPQEWANSARRDGGRVFIAPVELLDPGADAWVGLDRAGFSESIDAAVNWGNGKAYLFKADPYVRYDMAADRTDDGYPLPIADHWSGLAAAGFADGIDAVGCG